MVNKLAQSYPSGKRKSWDWNPGLSEPITHVLSTVLQKESKKETWEGKKRAT